MIPFIEQIMFALMLSSTYALISVGFTLFFGAINIGQFSQGMWPCSVLSRHHPLWCFCLQRIDGVIPFWIGALVIIVITCILVGFLGTFFERTVIKPFRRSPLLMVLVATIALGIVIRNPSAFFIPRAATPRFFRDTPQRSFHLGDLVIRWNHLLILLMSILLIVSWSSSSIVPKPGWPSGPFPRIWRPRISWGSIPIGSLP